MANSAFPTPVIPILLRLPQVNSTFLHRCPREIRDQIYENALRPDSGPGPATNLLLACTRVYHEAGIILYSLNAIHISMNGSDDKTNGRWRKMVGPEKWAVADLTFYVNPFWAGWSATGVDGLKSWTADPVFRPAKINVVVCAVAQLGSLPYHIGEIAKAIQRSKGLREGTLELRTRKGREPKFDQYIQRLLTIKIKLVEGGILQWDQKRPIVWDGEREKEYEKREKESIEPEDVNKIWWIKIHWVVS